ncbi:MAG: response regulator [Deltaproteobacteria bacterium]
MNANPCDGAGAAVLSGNGERLLVVDDEEFIRLLVRERLEIAGYSVDEASHGKEALDRMAERPYAALLTDIRMPVLDGIALVQEVSARYPDTARIVMTAYAELETAVAALKAGAFDYLIKPFSFEVMLVTIRNALSKRAMAIRLRDYQETLEQKVREQTDLINSMYVRSIHSLIKALEAKDHYTRGHSQRVTLYSVAIGSRLGFDRNRLDRLRRAAVLHDLGKIGIREAVLNKPSRLTDREFGEIHHHPELVIRILSPIPFFRPLLPFILHHHERMDGTGYPGRLGGEEIPLESRILSVSDAFDAMTSTRAYRKALPRQEALAEIRRCAGSQFDPVVVDCFLGIRSVASPDGEALPDGWGEEDLFEEPPPASATASGGRGAEFREPWDVSTR